jgi:DNA-binding winged helix-turn-helix (wHTH) protein
VATRDHAMATRHHDAPTGGSGGLIGDEQIYQFGEFCLDVGRAELWRGEERRGLQPLILDLLAYLIAHRGRVASKDELFRNVWGGDVFVVDTALTTAVCEARKAIDDDHVQQWAIRTVPRRGYRFIAPTAEGARV